MGPCFDVKLIFNPILVRLKILPRRAIIMPQGTTAKFSISPFQPMDGGASTTYGMHLVRWCSSHQRLKQAHQHGASTKSLVDAGNISKCGGHRHARCRDALPKTWKEEASIESYHPPVLSEHLGRSMRACIPRSSLKHRIRFCMTSDETGRDFAV